MNQKDLLQLLKEATGPDISFKRKLEIVDILVTACSQKEFKAGIRVVKDGSFLITNIVAKVLRDMFSNGMSHNLPRLFPFFVLMCSDSDEIDKGLLRST